MGAEPPVFFSKPADAMVESGAIIPYPTLTHNLHHEIELVAALAQGRRRHSRRAGARLRLSAMPPAST